MCEIVVGLLGASPLIFAIFGGLMAFNRGTVYSIVERYTYEFFSQGYIRRTDQYVEIMTDYAMEIVKPVGVAIFVISFLLLMLSIYGRIAATCSSKPMLYSHLVMLGIILFVEIVLLITYAAKRGELVDTYVAHFKEASANYRSLQSAEPDSLFAGLVMASENCCGFENGTEYSSSKKLSREDTYRTVSYQGLMYPIACCKGEFLGTGQSNCPAEFTSESSNINTGCAKPLRDKTIYFLNILAYSSILVFLLTVLAFTVEIILLCCQ